MCVCVCACACVCVYMCAREGVVCEEYNIMTRYYFCFDLVKRGVLATVDEIRHYRNGR